MLRRGFSFLLTTKGIQMKNKTYYQTFKCSRCDLERSDSNKHLFYDSKSSSCYCRKCNNEIVKERRAKGKLKKDIEFSDYNDVEKWYKAHGTKGMKESGDSIVKTMKSIWGNKWEWTPSEKHAEMSIVMQWSYGCLRKRLEIQEFERGG
jgi:hypothetical protein